MDNLRGRNAGRWRSKSVNFNLFNLNREKRMESATGKGFERWKRLQPLLQPTDSRVGLYGAASEPLHPAIRDPWRWKVEVPLMASTFNLFNLPEDDRK